MEKKQTAETVAARGGDGQPGLKARFGDAWDAVEKARRELPPLQHRARDVRRRPRRLSPTTSRMRARCCAGRRRARSRTASGCRSTPTRASRRSRRRSAPTRRSIPGSKRRASPAGLAFMRDKLGAEHALVQAGPRGQDAGGARRGARRRHHARRSGGAQAALRRRRGRRQGVHAIRSSRWRA